MEEYLTSKKFTHRAYICDMLYSPMYAIQVKYLIEAELKGRDAIPSPGKFRQTLDDFHIEQDLIDEMYQGFGKLESKQTRR